MRARESHVGVETTDHRENADYLCNAFIYSSGDAALDADEPREDVLLESKRSLGVREPATAAVRGNRRLRHLVDRQLDVPVLALDVGDQPFDDGLGLVEDLGLDLSDDPVQRDEPR